MLQGGPWLISLLAYRRLDRRVYWFSLFLPDIFLRHYSQIPHDRLHPCVSCYIITVTVLHNLTISINIVKANHRGDKFWDVWIEQRIWQNCTMRNSTIGILRLILSERLNQIGRTEKWLQNFGRKYQWEEVTCVEEMIISLESVEWIKIFQNTFTGMALVNTVIKLPVRNM